MNKQLYNTKEYVFNTIQRLIVPLCLACYFILTHTYGQNIDTSEKDLKETSLFKKPSDLSFNSLLEQYIQSNGNSSYIEFNSSNIKEYWITTGVISSRENIIILLKPKGSIEFSSELLPIQLTNVDPTMDCRIDIVTGGSDLSFSVFSSNKEIISSSFHNETFLDFNIISTTFSLRDTPDKMIYLSLSSKRETEISINKILLSFTKNHFYYSDKGLISITPNSINTIRNSTIDSNECILTGKRTFMLFPHIINTNRDSFKGINYSIDVVNEGNISLRFYLFFRIYSKNGDILNGKNYPYKSLNKILHILSAEKGSNKILVDSYADWKKGCRVSLDAKNDLSDIPSTNLIDGLIIEIKKNENATSEITLSQPLSHSIKKGTPIRINGSTSNIDLYPVINEIKPGENIIFESSIELKDSFPQFNNKYLPKGTYYISPGILSISTDLSISNKIKINKIDLSF